MLLRGVRRNACAGFFMYATTPPDHPILLSSIFTSLHMTPNEG